VQSGIGFVGKNNMLITEKYGSYVFLGEIITNLYIEKDKLVQNKCGSCTVCKKVCPTGSINDKNNANICLSYITQKKDIEDKWFDKLDGRIFGCDTCQRFCPHNKDIKVSEIEEFRPYEFMEKANMDELLGLDKKAFRDKYIQTSCGWRGKNIIQRNVLINKVYKDKNIKSIKFSSSYVENYHSRILDYFKLL
jgi:epoxyqueuosine reductase QueG